MKKKITLILLLILIVATLAYARVVRSSGVLAATSATAASITASEGFLHKVIIRSDRTTTCNFNLYDYATNGGYTTTEIELIPTWTVTTTETGSFYVQMDIPRVPFVEGLYYTISSTGEMIVFYEQ